MNVTFAKSDLSNSNVRSQIVSLIADAKHGGFIKVHSLRPKNGYGEVSDYVFCKGINYGNAIDKSLEMLKDIIADSDFSVEVKRGVWEASKDSIWETTDENGLDVKIPVMKGEYSPKNRKNKAFDVFKVVTKTYKQGDDALVKALGKIGQSLIAPEDATKVYTVLGNGIHEDKDSNLFLRDLRLVSKTVLVSGEYPKKASGEEVAIADTIKRSMPVGNYREFYLDGDYQSISIDGVSLSQEVEQVKEEELVEA